MGYVHFPPKGPPHSKGGDPLLTIRERGNGEKEHLGQFVVEDKVLCGGGEWRLRRLESLDLQLHLLPTEAGSWRH